MAERRSQRRNSDPSGPGAGLLRQVGGASSCAGAEVLPPRCGSPPAPVRKSSGPSAEVLLGAV